MEHSGHDSETASRRPTVSIVLATYNGSAYLPEQLASLRQQNDPPDELIVVDDGSSDSTCDIVRRFARTCPFPVELIEQRQHDGTCLTFERGLRRAGGKVILICDQDDRWRPEKTAVMAEAMARHQDALMAFSDAVLIDANGHKLSRSRWRIAGFGTRQRSRLAEDPLGLILARQVVSGCTMAIRSGFLDAILPFPTGIHPALGDVMYDRWISLVAAAAGPVVAIPERLVEYRIHQGQQIGIPGLRLRRYGPRSTLHAAQFLINRSERSARADYHGAHLTEVRKRLETTSLDCGSSILRLNLADKHLAVRRQLPTNPTRVRSVLSEYLDEDGYRRFSLGWSSAVADMMR